MKKLIILLLCCGVLVSMVGCGGNTAPPPTESPSTTVSETIITETPIKTTPPVTAVELTEKEKEPVSTESKNRTVEPTVTATTISTDYDCEYIELGDSIINDSKLFKFVYDAKRNAYKICPKSSLDKCFAVAFSYCTDSASVVISADKDTDNRYFMLEKISDVITSSATYQDNGNYPHTVTDSRGNTTTYTYDTARGLQTGITDAVGNTTKYSYNSQNDRLQSVSIGNSSVNYTYETGGSLKSITSPSGTVYNFKYDEFGNTSKILVGSKTLTQNTYDATRGLLTNSTYGNGQKIGYT